MGLSVGLTRSRPLRNTRGSDPPTGDPSTNTPSPADSSTSAAGKHYR